MGNSEKLMNQILDLRLMSKSLQRQAHKCDKEEKEQKVKMKKAIDKGNMEHTNYLRLASRPDAIVSRLDTQAKMQVIGRSMGNIVRSLDSALTTGNLQKI